MQFCMKTISAHEHANPWSAHAQIPGNPLSRLNQYATWKNKITFYITSIQCAKNVNQAIQSVFHRILATELE